MSLPVAGVGGCTELSVRYIVGKSRHTQSSHRITAGGKRRVAIPGVLVAGHPVQRGGGAFLGSCDRMLCSPRPRSPFVADKHSLQAMEGGWMAGSTGVTAHQGRGGRERGGHDRATRTPPSFLFCNHSSGASGPQPAPSGGSAALSLCLARHSHASRGPPLPGGAR